jgi:hypothetical protein
LSSFTFTTGTNQTGTARSLWIDQEIAATFRSLAISAPAPAHSPELGACTPEEALRVFETIRHDFAGAQVLFELGREQPVGHAPALHAFSIGGIKRRLQLGDDRLADCFGAIKRCFMHVRNDPEATLFGFIRTTTSMSTRQPIGVSETSGKSRSVFRQDQSRFGRTRADLCHSDSCPRSWPEREHWYTLRKTVQVRESVVEP